MTYMLPGIFYLRLIPRDEQESHFWCASCIAFCFSFSSRTSLIDKKSAFAGLDALTNSAKGAWRRSANAFARVWMLRSMLLSFPMTALSKFVCSHLNRSCAVVFLCKSLRIPQPVCPHIVPFLPHTYIRATRLGSWVLVVLGAVLLPVCLAAIFLFKH